jgi:hypothetical protein
VDWLSSRFARRRVRPAHRDTELSQPRAEEWLLIEWPHGEAEPTKYWLATLPEEISFEDLALLTPPAAIAGDCNLWTVRAREGFVFPSPPVLLRADGMKAALKRNWQRNLGSGLCVLPYPHLKAFQIDTVAPIHYISALAPVH